MIEEEHIINQHEAQTLFQHARALEHAKLISNELFVTIKKLIENRYDIRLYTSHEKLPKWME